MPQPEELRVKTLGVATIPSPLRLGAPLTGYVDDRTRIAFHIEQIDGQSPQEHCWFEAGGPREFLYFDPAQITAGIVTCGGLCPGLNNVVRSLVLELHHKYGVRRILGFRYGFEGMTRRGQEPLLLTPEIVAHIHQQGGSLLGQSRGKQDPSEIVDVLVERGVHVLFPVGGDGTLRGAHAIYQEAERRGLKIAVVGVPKTIDNDVPYVDRTFGFETAVEVARQAVDAAHVEALATHNGVGLVKLMGRDAGFIAAAATLASREVNFCLVPEVPFRLDGPRGLLAALETRLTQRGHAVIVVAEGCGAALLEGEGERDASGNLRYASADLDIGIHLRDAITLHFRERRIPLSLKYIDPSYMIRSVPANASDSIFCDALARHAVHAALAGKTDLVVGRWHRRFTHIPLTLVTSTHRRMDPTGELWFSVTEATGQQPMV
ncbi:MAG: ATP-dependent 6-phosphofructokinase [Myxococcales bacterium]|nr:ATP-dependent 6-phosphofructokinase [Polyangiaceae bacterium]MDW8249193.1 ATP-dependent 6-phosphofructokinase [Myxococcales bacterium]